MFAKEKIEAIDHKNPPVPHTPEKLKALNDAQAAAEAKSSASKAQSPAPAKTN